MSRLIDWLLNLVYLALLLAAAPWIIWARLRRGKYREGFQQKLLGRVPRRAGDGSCVWLHAVSVGEVNLLDVTIRELLARRPDVSIAISTTTKSGYDLARTKYADYMVFYCPLDFSWAVAETLRRIRPDLLVLMELELWPNLIRAAKFRGVKVAVVNGRLSDHSYRGYARFRRLVAPIVRRLDLVAAQDEPTAERFGRLGTRPEALCITGSLKFDGAVADRRHPRTLRLRQLAAIDQGDPILLAGSTQAPEEDTALSAFRDALKREPNLRLIIVPRHPERFDEVAHLIAGAGFPWTRRSELGNPGDALAASWKVLLIDSVGELGAWWGAATIGLVGGSFGSRGGQNMLEPAALGVATCFGPNTWNFRDIVRRLLAADGAVVVHNRGEFANFVERCLSDAEYAATLGRNARQCVASQQGAGARTGDALAPLLPSRTSSSHRNDAAPGGSKRVA